MPPSDIEYAAARVNDDEDAAVAALVGVVTSPAVHDLETLETEQSRDFSQPNLVRRLSHLIKKLLSPAP